MIEETTFETEVCKNKDEQDFEENFEISDDEIEYLTNVEII